MSLGKEQESFSRDLTQLLTWLFKNGYEVRMGEVERTKEQQAIYLRTGRSKTANSMHLKRLAADLFIFKDGKWLTSKADLQAVGEYWESLDPTNRWGGNFKSFTDTPHFERNFA